MWLISCEYTNYVTCLGLSCPSSEVSSLLIRNTVHIRSTYVCLYVQGSYTRSYSKVRELAAVCLPWQQWTETSVWFDDVGISEFDSCVDVDLWQSFAEWLLLLSVFWCAVARMSELELEQRTNITFLVKVGKAMSSSETSVHTRCTRYYIPEDGILKNISYLLSSVSI
jgi:hypothetical protein